MRVLYDKYGDIITEIPGENFELDTRGATNGCGDIPWQELGDLPFLDLQWTLLNAGFMGLFLLVVSPALMFLFCWVSLYRWLNE